MDSSEDKASNDDKVGGALVLNSAVTLMLMLVSRLFVGCVNMFLYSTFRSTEVATYTFVNWVGIHSLSAFFSFFRYGPY